jgi:succinate dehydrogenase hydrophobic anchor subunit
VITERPRAARRNSNFWHIWAPGIGLAAIALALVVVIASLDAAQSDKYHSVLQLLSPDAAAAAWTMSLIGTSEGVAIAIVIVVVVLGIQLTADRYSPRIIDIFVRDPMNLLVLGLFLASIVFTIWMSAEIKADYVPRLGVDTAILLAVVDFTLLLPYVRYMFSIMRAETIIRSLRQRAATAVRRAARNGHDLAPRHAMRDCLAQISDIALGSIQEGDTEVCLAAIEALRELMVDTYVPLKAQLDATWFSVDNVDMPGASDQTIAHVDRTHTWVEHTVLSDFLDLIGETPAFRKEVIHSIARATRSIGEAAIARDDRALEDLVVRFFNTYLRAAMNQRAPTFVYSTFNEYRLLAISAVETRPELLLRVAEHLVSYGRSFDAAGMHFIIGTAAEDVADMTMKVAPVDLDRSILLAQLLTRTLSNMAPSAQPISLNGVLKATIKLALWSLSVELAEITGTLLIGITTVSRQFTEDALERMERTTQDVFSEVSDRVVAFDWVEPDLRELIPLLRIRLADAAESAGAVAAATSSRARRSRPD